MYGDLLHVSVATAGNDHRLGGNAGLLLPSFSMFIAVDLASVLIIIEADAESETKKNSYHDRRSESAAHFVKDDRPEQDLPVCLYRHQI